MEYQALGAILKKARTDCGFTQNDIANQLGVTFQNVSSWERGKSKIDIDTLITLCRIYQINFIKVLAEVTKTPIQQTEDFTKADLLNNYEMLNPEGRLKLKEYSDDLIETRRYTSQPEPEQPQFNTLEEAKAYIKEKNQRKAVMAAFGGDKQIVEINYSKADLDEAMAIIAQRRQAREKE